MDFPKKHRIIHNGFLYESQLNDLEKQKLVEVIKNIMSELVSLETKVESKPIINRRQVVKKNLRSTVSTFSREFPELDLSQLQPVIEKLLA